MAFRSEDDAYSLWHPAERRPLLRAHCSLRTDPARHPAGHLRMASTSVYEEASNSEISDVFEHRNKKHNIQKQIEH